MVLLGDTRQLRAVDAGQPFRVLQKTGMATTVMDEVHGRSGYGFSTGDEKVRIEGEVQDVRGHFLVSVRITACPDDRGPSPGSAVRLPMNELLEFDCARILRDDEDARARLAADDRREIARREALVAEQLLERDRRRGRAIDRDEDHDLSM